MLNEQIGPYKIISKLGEGGMAQVQRPNTIAIALRILPTFVVLFAFFTGSQNIEAQSIFENPDVVQKLLNRSEVKKNSNYYLNRQKHPPPSVIDVPLEYKINITGDSVCIILPLSETDTAMAAFPSDIFILSGYDKKELTDIFLKRIQPFTREYSSTENFNSITKQDSAKNTAQTILTDSLYNQIYLPELFTSQPAPSEIVNQKTFKENAVALLADFTGSTPDDSVTFSLRTYGFKKVIFTLKPGVFFDNLAYAPFEIKAGSDKTGAALFLKHQLFNFGHMLFIHYDENQTRNIECLMYIPVDDLKKTMETYKLQNNDD